LQFETWLRKHIKFDTPIGDLARDWVDDDAVKPFTLAYLSTRKGVSQEAILTYKKAIKKYVNDVYLKT